MRASFALASLGVVAAGVPSALRGVSSAVSTQGGCSGTSYDFFMLVTQWDITECMDVFNCQTTNNWFTMHGLWPNDNNGDYPCDCTSEAFDPSQVADILPELNKFWPSLNGANSDFWSHEWSKHGTCANDVLASQHAYFSAALSVRSKYDTAAALAAAGYTPNNTQGFTMAAFKAATSTAFGFPAVLSCDSNGNIEEVTVCLDKTLAAIQCPSATSDDCNANTLYIPATVNATMV